MNKDNVIEELEEYEQKVMDEYLDHKIRQYSYQDKKANREVDDENLVNKNWFKQYYGRSCPGWRDACGITFTFEITDISKGRGKGNLTADRIRDDQPHTLDNVQPLCIACNCNKSNSGTLQQ